MGLSIGERMKEARKSKDLTLEEVSALVPITKSTLHKYETGIITKIPSDKIERIAEILEVTPSFLMGWGEPGDETDEELEKWFKDKDVREIARTVAGIKAQNGDMKTVKRMLEVFLPDKK